MFMIINEKMIETKYMITMTARKKRIFPLMIINIKTEAIIQRTKIIYLLYTHRVIPYHPEMDRADSGPAVPRS
jgi:hypothetical protein